MKKKMRIVFTAIIGVLLLSIMTSKVYAEEDYNTTEVCESFSNSMYPKSKFHSISQDYNYVSYGASTDTEYVDTLDNGALYLRSEMVNRSSIISFMVRCPYYEGIIKDVFNRAVEDEKTSGPSEGDYLLKNFSSYNCKVKIRNRGSIEEVTFIYSMDYLSTKEEENKVDNAVDSFLNKYGIYKMNDFNKVKTIHDYIVNNVEYDYDYMNYSAYNAMIDKCAVCQGFASLAYKMFKKAEIPVRIITGTNEKGESHAWNIVCVDGDWYNIDTTWDENISEGDICYTYFLKSEKDFPKHFRDSQYKGDFERKYPISKYSYSTDKSNGGSYNRIDERMDVNGDGAVNEIDLILVASKYNVNYESAQWNSKYDVNGDKFIDIYDLVAIAIKLE